MFLVFILFSFWFHIFCMFYNSFYTYFHGGTHNLINFNVVAVQPRVGGGQLGARNARGVCSAWGQS